MNTAARLDRALKLAGIPIVGVSIGVPADRATWRIDFDVSATDQQRTDADTIRRTFDPASVAAVDAEKAVAAGQIDSDLLIQAIAMLDFEERQKLVVQAGQTLRTLPQCRARARAIYQALLP